MTASDYPTLALALGAASVGALHTTAPDHWIPFAALARARGWSAARTAQLTLLCGFGHVTVSAALGLFALWVGVQVLEAFGRQLESVAGLLLIAFGLAWAAFGIRRGLQRKLHGHAGGHPGHPAAPAPSQAHAHHPHDGHGHAAAHAPSHHAHAPARRAEEPRAPEGHHHLLDHEHLPRSDRAAAFSLLVLFSADPCIALIPFLLAAAPLGAARTAFVVVAYEVATMATMTALVLLARAGARAVRIDGAWLARWGDGAAGSVIALVGLIVLLLGI